MSDTPEEAARKKKLLEEIWALEEQMALENEELTIDEIVAITKRVRKELAEERLKGQNK